MDARKFIHNFPVGANLAGTATAVYLVCYLLDFVSARRMPGTGLATPFLAAWEYQKGNRSSRFREAIMPEFRRVFRVQGLDSQADPRFQMVPTGGHRYVALHDGAGMSVTSTPPAICTVTEIREADLPVDDRATGPVAATSGDRFFRLDGQAKGVAFLVAFKVPLLPLLLEVGVKDKLTQHVHFYSVRDNAGHHSNRPLAVVGGWRPNLNYIWKRQANVEIVQHGALEQLRINQNPGDPIMLGTTGLGTDGAVVANAGDDSADLKVFFVWEIQRPIPNWDTDATTRTIGSAHNGETGAILFEDDAGPDQMLSLAHEIGHHMGLSHNEGNRVDLMWPVTGERGLNLTKDEVNIANP